MCNCISEASISGVRFPCCYTSYLLPCFVSGFAFYLLLEVEDRRLAVV